MIDEWTQIRIKLKIVFMTADTTKWSEYLIWRNYKMAKALFELLSGTYHEENRYFIPNLKLPDKEEQLIDLFWRGTWIV